MKSTGLSVDKLMGRMFRKVDSVVWDLMSGKLGVRTRDGEIATIEGEGDDATIVINPFEDFGIAIPAFAQNTPVDSVKVGDLIYTSGESPGWIVAIKDNATTGKKSFRIIRSGGNVSSWVPPKVQMFGLDGGVLVVRSLMTMLPGGADGLAGLQGSLLPMLALGGDGLDMDKILPLMLMSQVGGGAAGAANPMGGIMQMMLMQKMLGGGDGGLGNLFGGSGSKSSPFNR
jgi:hypothetical protein